MQIYELSLKSRTELCRSEEAYLNKQIRTLKRHAKKLSDNSPLMDIIQADIDKAGGWYLWRDKCILENLATMAWDERQRIKVRIRNREAVPDRLMNLNRSKLL